MAYHNHHHHHHGRRHYEWNPSNEYQVYKPVAEAATGGGFRSPKHHMAFKTEKEASERQRGGTALAETEAALERIRHRDHNDSEDVDEEADAFIRLEHKRIELT